MPKHLEGLGKAWLSLVADPQNRIPGFVALTVGKGGTRECWRQHDDGIDTLIMGWPEVAGLRLGVTLRGGLGEKLQPISAFPLLEGLPNDMTVDTVHAWENEAEGVVAAKRNEGATSLWFYNPFLFRDREQLTEGVRPTFLLAGLAYRLRHALLDTMTITQGPDYEEFARDWMAKHPGATRLDVPQLQIPLRGSRILIPDEFYGEYQARVPVTKVETGELGPEKIYMIIVEFGLDTANPLRFPLYAPARICEGGYEPKAGDDIDVYLWLQGRILD